MACDLLALAGVVVEPARRRGGRREVARVEVALEPPQRFAVATAPAPATPAAAAVEAEGAGVGTLCAETWYV